jgi:hypothetical protein
VRLYLAGGEVPSHRKILTESQAPHVALSFVGLRRRVKFSRPWLLADKFHDDARIFVDSGAYTVNTKDEDAYSQRELKDMYLSYRAFVDSNLDRIEFASEFDALPLGRNWIENERDWWLDMLGPDKLLVIWHPDWGIEVLQEMARTYKRIGVPQTALGGRNLVPLLNSLVSRYGVKLHGVAMTKVEEMQTVQWDSVASTSWISPQRYGDTIVWANNELKRYPKAYKEQARKRHRTLFERIGLDPQKVEDGDATEVLRLSLWSWRQLEDHINRHHGEPSAPEQDKVVTTPQDEDTDPFDASGLPVVDSPGPETAHRASTPVQRDKVPIPVMGLGKRTSKVQNEDGTEEDVEVSVIGIRSESTRVCDSCFLANKCPSFEPGSACKYDIPIQIKTRDQFKSLQDALIEMQTQRVLFMRFAEEAEGGYSDPNLSGEIDRLNKMIKQKFELEEGTFSLRIDAKGSGGGPGMLARLFGDEASERARALPEPVPADRAIEQYYPDAEVVER